MNWERRGNRDEGTGNRKRKTDACEMLNVGRDRKCEKAQWPNEPKLVASAMPPVDWAGNRSPKRCPAPGLGKTNAEFEVRNSGFGVRNGERWHAEARANAATHETRATRHSQRGTNHESRTTQKRNGQTNPRPVQAQRREQHGWKWGTAILPESPLGVPLLFARGRSCG